jgi:hypothetical protein
MPYLETVDELTEALADMLGIYDQRLRFAGMSVAETRVYTEARQAGGQMVLFPEGHMS